MRNQTNSNDQLQSKSKHLKYLQEEVKYKQIETRLANSYFQNQIKIFQDQLIKEVCSDIPNAFWHRSKYIVSLPYEKDFEERNIPTKARPIQMSQELMEYCKKEISDLINKKLIRRSQSLWSCSAFYVQKNAELKRGTPKLVINYKPLNNALLWVRYPIPVNKYLISDYIKLPYSLNLI